MPSESRTLSGHGQTAAVIPPLCIDAAERRAALAHVPLAIAWLSLDGIVVEVNEALAALFGLDADQFSGRCLADVVEDAATVKELLDIVREGRSGSGPICIKGRDCSVLTVHCDVSPVKQAGRIAGSRWFLCQDAAPPPSNGDSSAPDTPLVVHRLRNSLAPITSGLDVLELDGVAPASLQELRDQLTQLESEIARLLVSAPAAQHQAERSQRIGTDDSSNRPTGAQTAPRILIVDDNPSIHRALQLLIHTLGYPDVQTASTGEAALARFAEGRPALVFLDIGLPDLDGLAVARRIRSLPGGSDAVLVALSGYGQPDDRREALAAGCDQHLVKPCRLDDLNRVLQHPRLQKTSSGAPPKQPAIVSNPRAPDASASHTNAADSSDPLAARLGQLLREFVHDARTAAFPLQIHQHLLEKSDQPVPEDDTAAVLREYLAHCETLHGVMRRAGLLLRDEFDPHFGSVPVQDVIDRAVEDGNRRFADQSIRIIAPAPLEGVRIRADRELLVQALAELLDNAAHASPVGASVTIESVHSDVWVVISVCDSGPGIPADLAANTPQAFERPGGKLEPLRGQIGVGLAIARRIAELHGGHLRFDPRPSQGCRAILELPADNQTR